MTRPLRIEYSGALYHLTGNGNAGGPICCDDEDRELFITVLSHVVKRFSWRLYAYCLLSNHYHLLVETRLPNLSAAMRQLNGVYTQSFNRRHGTRGHLFQGRYKAILVERDRYFLEVARHIVLNPVRFDKTVDLANYKWSSYPATSGSAINPNWLSSNSILNRLGQTKKMAHRRYVEFIDAGRQLPTLWSNLRQQIYLGDDAFIVAQQAHLSNVKTSSEISKPQISLPIKTLSNYTNQHSKAADAIVAAYRSGHYSLKAVAQHLGVHYSTISRLIKNNERNL